MYRPERAIKRHQHPIDGLDESRENIIGATALENPNYPSRRPLGNLNPVRHVGPSQQYIAQISPSDSLDHVVKLAKDAVVAAREETQRSVSHAGKVKNSLRPGLTIDLGHKKIQRIPEEVVNIIKDEIERLALPHNQIWAFPRKFSLCTRLRYLNVRSNSLRVFPHPICELVSLEILDLSRNRLGALPEEIGGLTSLKVFSVQRNRLDRLPLALGDINTLQVLKLEGNPLVFPPKEITELDEIESLLNTASENEKDAAITTQVKRYLKHRKALGKPGNESGGESSEGFNQTPRPTKRIVSGQSPVKASTSGSESASDEKVSVLPRLPPIPSRPHRRTQSRENTTLRRPGVAPSVVGNERSRSNSESGLQATGREKRFGMVTRKTSDLGTVDETRSTRYNHNRGLSHGSVMHDKQNYDNGGGGQNITSPGSPADTERQRGTFVRRLSSLPEHKRDYMIPDPLIRGAKGVLFALFLIHPQLANLIIVVRNGASKRSSVERVFYNASTHIEALDRALHNISAFDEEDEESHFHSSEGIQDTCGTSLVAYGHVGSLLLRDVGMLIRRGNRRYIRTLLLLAYGSVMELRNACFGINTKPKSKHSASRAVRDKRRRDNSVTPTRERPNPPNPTKRLGKVTVAQNSPIAGPSTKRIPPTNQVNSNRNNTLTCSFPVTPRSAESMQRSGTALLNSRSNTMRMSEEVEEERKFEKIFLHLGVALSAAQKALPTLQREILRCLDAARARTGNAQAESICSDLNDKTSAALRATEALKRRLSTVKLKEHGVRGQPEFWQLCIGFIRAFVAMVNDLKTAKSYGLLSPDIQQVLLPVQRATKEASKLIKESPWKDLVDALPPPVYTPPPPITQSMIQNILQHGGPGSASSASAGVASSSYISPLPPTPLSAALGPAAQATVPSTPSAHQNGPFSGNVFERADSLLSMPMRRQ